MLINEIKDRILMSVKQNTLDKDVLRVILGETQTVEMRTKAKISDDGVVSIVKKMLSNNLEAIKAIEVPRIGLEAADSNTKRKLEAENIILNSLLPKTIDLEKIKSILDPHVSELMIAKSDGSATGMAMKIIKESGNAVNGADVATVIRKIRGYL